MAEWAARRFWSQARAEAVEGGHGVWLDDRPLQGPDRAPMVLPSAALARAIAAEWQDQPQKVDPARLPVTRFANSALGIVRPRRAEVEAEVLGYGGTDLLCYRAEGPARLRARQAEAWDPVLDWLDRAHGARLAVTTGVMPVAQPPQALARLAEAIAALDHWRLTALAEAVALAGSLGLGLAALHGHLSAEEAWARSRLDEEFQAEDWGRDEEAAEAAAGRARAFATALRFDRLARGEDA